MACTSHIAADVCLLQVGLEMVPVYGDEQSGWSLDQGGVEGLVPSAFRYRSLDEVFFALVNLNLSSEGNA